jgi:branched-chain amino acid transport system permease protein
VQFIEPEEFGFARTVMPFTFVVVGGLQTFWGSLVGAAVLTLLPEWLRFLKEWRLALYGVAMLAVMIVRPQGLVDHRLVEAVRRMIPGAVKEALS